MTGKTGLVAVVLATTFGAAGCTTCNYQANAITLSPEECPGSCAAQRNGVTVFLINGIDVLDIGGMSKLRDRLNEAGFSQVYYGSTVNCGHFAREMKRIAKDDPETRFVIVGYGTGTGDAADLARQAGVNLVRVDTVILLDPSGVDPAAIVPVEAGVRVIQSDGWKNDALHPRAEVTTLSGVGHFELPSHAATAGCVLEVLKEAVTRVPLVEEGHLVIPLLDDPAPVPAVIPGPHGVVAVATNPWVMRASHFAPVGR
jgi:pimeloyl-ACP methyl ester carboxylesterase